MQINELLDIGVARGIISADQRAALGALNAPGPATVEAPRGFNGVMIAYGIGALVVLFGFAWFMIDRWQTLGGAGIFGLSVGYAAVFLVVAHVLKREGFATAHGVALLLAVGMTPLAMHGFLQWTGLWTPALGDLCMKQDHPFGACQGEPFALELSVVAAALIALRRAAFAPLVIPIAVVCVTMPERLLREWNSGGGIDGAAMGWRWIVVASLIAALAYEVDRRRTTEDYGVWLWLSSVFATVFGGILLYGTDPALRPWLGPVALLFVVASLILRRRKLLFLGMFGLLGFLAWLAGDVFKVTTAFPLVLALLGVAIIVATVWVQKRFPNVLQRLSGDPSKPPHFPGGVAALLTPALLGVLLMGNASALDRERAAIRRSHAHAGVARQRARRDSLTVERAKLRTRTDSVKSEQQAGRQPTPRR